MAQTDPFSFMQAPEPTIMVPIITEPKLQLSTISPSGVVITLEDLIDWDNS